MGNEPSSYSGNSRHNNDNDTVSSNISDVKSTVKSPANMLFDSICGATFFTEEEERDSRHRRSRDRYHNFSHDSDESSNTTYDSHQRHRKSKSHRSKKVDDSDSIISDEKDYSRRKKGSTNSPRRDRSKGEKTSSRSKDKKKEPNSTPDELNYNDEKNTSIPISQSASLEVDTLNTNANTNTLVKPMASSFAKRCYFTKAGIGKTTQHYEGLTLTGNTVLMLSTAMKLNGCPTICDEDLRRVEATYPNQFSRLPDELLLSSGWRRISKYCHFSGNSIPDGMPFFHSRERIHPATNGYFFLVASAIGMERPTEIERISMDTLVLLQTDYPNQCDLAPPELVQDPTQWTLVNKFCFFSGGPINAEEDVYYEADFDGNSIFMLAFLSPSLTAEELYQLNDITGENAFKTVAAVEEVENVYNLTERDFDDLKLYHLGPCRALPSFILNPASWKKVLPLHYQECRDKALARAYEFETHAQEAIAAAGGKLGTGQQDGYVEFGGGKVMLPQQQQQVTGYNMNLHDQRIGGDVQNVVANSPQNAMTFNTPMPFSGNTNAFYSGLKDRLQTEGQQYGTHIEGNTNSPPLSVTPNPPPPPPNNSSPSPFGPSTDFPPHDLNGTPYRNSQSNIKSPQELAIQQEMKRAVMEEGVILDSSQPIDEAIATHMANVSEQISLHNSPNDNEKNPDPSAVMMSSPKPSQKNDLPRMENFESESNAILATSPVETIDQSPPEKAVIEDEDLPSDCESQDSNYGIEDIVGKPLSPLMNIDPNMDEHFSFVKAESDSDGSQNNELDLTAIEESNLNISQLPDQHSIASGDDFSGSNPSNHSRASNHSEYSPGNGNHAHRNGHYVSSTSDFISLDSVKDRSQSSFLSPRDDTSFSNSQTKSPQLTPRRAELARHVNNGYSSSPTRNSDGSQGSPRYDPSSPRSKTRNNQFSPTYNSSGKESSGISFDDISENDNSENDNPSDVPATSPETTKTIPQQQQQQQQPIESRIPATTSSADDSSHFSGYSYSKSSAMKGAQQLLKQNRQKRLELMAKRRATQEKLLASAAQLVESVETESSSSPTNQENDESRSVSMANSAFPSKVSKRASSPHIREAPMNVLSSPPPAPSSPNRESYSRRKDDDMTDCTSLASNPSSVWTDDASNVEKNSRRALILQMAKNRMKGKSDKSSRTKGSRFNKMKSLHRADEVESKVASSAMDLD